MEREMRLGKFSEDEIQKLPYLGPTSRRIYVVKHTQSSSATRELFVQRNDAFTTNLAGLLKSMKVGEISEVRYSCGYDGFIRIYRTQKGNLAGEYFGKSKKTLKDLKLKLAMRKLS